MVSRVFVKRLTIVAIGVGFSFCLSARAGINGADTLEWLACASEVVAVGQIANVTTVKGPYDVIYEDCALRATEMIKGTPARDIVFSYRHFRRDDTSWIRPQTELLVFLRHGKSDSESRIQKLFVPTTDRNPLSVFAVRKPPPDLFDRQRRRLAQRAEILGIARAWAKSPIADYLERDAAFDSDAFRELYAGSAVWLKVPAEEKYRAEFMGLAHSANLYDRIKAAEELGKYPGLETEMLLGKLLDDTTELQSFYAADTIWRVHLPVREGAYNSLKKLGMVLPDLSLERMPTDEE
jgi:hypothetical protein